MKQMGSMMEAGRSRLTQSVIVLIAGYILVNILYIGQDIIVPIVFAALFSVLLYPLVKFLLKKRVPRIVAIGIAICIGFLLLLSLIWFIGSQLNLFSEKLPSLQGKIEQMNASLANWVADTFHVKPAKVDQWILTARSELLSHGGALIGSTLSTLSGMLILVCLIPIYIFLMLYYEPIFVEFIKRIFPGHNLYAVSDIIIESQSAMQQYLAGLLLEAIIVAILNSAGLFMLGIEYALLLGIIGALLNVIPYIGGVIAVALPVLMAIITKDSFSYVYLVMLLYAVVQFIDNNIIVPRVVASRVKINALVSIIAVLAGGALWGVPGMFLSIPITAVIKIVCDRVTPLKPFGFLLGDSIPKGTRGLFRKNFRFR